jgi:hypothetical protein
MARKSQVVATRFSDVFRSGSTLILGIVQIKPKQANEKATQY